MALTPDQQRRMRVRRMNLLMAYASFASSKAVAWTPAELFAQGEQGVWYDPSDMTTLFQDAAGTTPVTAVEQPVGLVLDKSGRGNHASQSTSASRPVLSARVNTLVNTDTLSTQSVTTLAINYTLRFEGTGSIALSGTGSGTYSAGSHTVTCTAGTLTLTVTGSVTNADLRPANAGVNLPAYQRVGAATDGTSTTAGNADYDTTGFPLYLKFDGTDDFLVSGTINPGSVDKAQVFAGVRKLSDANIGIIAELSVVANSNDGSFALAAPGWAPNLTNRYGSLIRGSASILYAETPSNFASPITNVLTEKIDLGASTSATRLGLAVNGTTQTLAYTDGGIASSNFGSYPLYVGARFGTTTRSLFLNGHLYSLALRFSSTNLDAATISQMEQWVASKTGVSI